MKSRQEVLETLAREPASSGLFTDFDGTLSPIVSDPESAVPLPAGLRALGILGHRLGRVAVVSGRPASFLARHFLTEESGPVELYGLHGLERWAGESAEPVPEAREWAGAVAEAVSEARRVAIPGVVVEDKGFALTLHWRKAADPARTGSEGIALAGELARENGLLPKPGKASVELVPPTGIDKGWVIRRESAGLSAAAFLGDDAGDLAAFDALAELADRGGEVFCVGVDSPEAPAELIERADLVLAGPEEAAALLSELAEMLGG